MPARSGEVPVCALDNKKGITVVFEGGSSAGVGIDEEVQWNNKPALGLRGDWAMAWDSVILELKPVELAGEPDTVYLAFKSDTNLIGKIQVTIKDSKGETLQTTLSKSVNNADWQELQAPLPGLEAVWDGGDASHRLNPPCVLTSLIIYARQPARTTVFFSILRLNCANQSRRPNKAATPSGAFRALGGDQLFQPGQ